MILTYLLWGLLIYFGYRFIFNFVVPVVKATRQVKSQMREFQSRMQEQQQQQTQHTSSTFVKTAANSSDSKEDYIDFEEIK